MRIEVPDTKSTVEIEELSPDAIIPDSVTVMRDPEIEVPRDDNVVADSLEDRLTGIDLDGARAIDEVPVDPPKIWTPRKRKRSTVLADDEVDYERQRKRTVSPGSFSPAKGTE
jgi:hypothetical protein